MKPLHLKHRLKQVLHKLGCRLVRFGVHDDSVEYAKYLKRKYGTSDQVFAELEASLLAQSSLESQLQSSKNELRTLRLKNVVLRCKLKALF